ncbi:phosphopantetheine-binding protein [Streptomyces sp. CA-181903]|uniref:phosphopantetheine-binding protein n=1 Tax=Streptomyces sp. CA-181903 TaxID=3240055 RepID=UPI003D94E491
MASVEDRVKKLLAQKLAVEPQEVTPQAQLREDLGEEDGDNGPLAHALSQEFGITCEEGDIAEMFSVQEVIDFVKKRT